MSEFLKYLIALVVGFLFGLLVHNLLKDHEETPDPVILTDTIHVNDTIIRDKTKYVFSTSYDTIVVRDTDTIRIEIPIDHKQYSDTFRTDSSLIALGIEYSGYRANIDNIDMTYRFQVDPRTIVKKKGWGQFVGVGAYAGYGLGLNGNTVLATPSVGVSIVYGFGYHW